MRYLFFDLDGTLCESKQRVELPLFYELERLNAKYKICIISGAELPRLLSQCALPYATFMAQNGNEAWEGENFLWKNAFNKKEEVTAHFNTCLTELQITLEEDMIDDRGAQISCSFVGHHATPEKKKRFDFHREKRIALLDKFPFKGAVIGGTTCIDYVPFTKGENITRYLEYKKLKWHECMYIGDGFMKHGNDETVMGIVPAFKVNNHKETLKFLKQLW